MKKNKLDLYPSDVIQRWLDEHKFKQAWLAKAMRRPEKTISEIMSGKTRVTAETAIEVCHITGIKCEYLLSLQNRLDLDKAQESLKQSKECVCMAEELGLSECKIHDEHCLQSKERKV